MAIQHGIWKIGEKPQALKPISIDSEELLEQQIFQDISILNSSWLLIGRQVYTDFGKPLDLLAIDVSGSLIVIELKKHKTPVYVNSLRRTARTFRRFITCRSCSKTLTA